MALQAIQQEQVQQTAQAMLAFFDREDVSIPGSMLESIVSGKSLLRALVQGQLVIAQEAQPQPKAEPPAETPDAKKKRPAKKKAA